MLSELIKNSADEGYIKGIDNSSKFVKNTIKSIAKTVESLTTLSPEVQAFMRSFIQSYFKDENLQKQLNLKYLMMSLKKAICNNKKHTFHYSKIKQNIILLCKY